MNERGQRHEGKAPKGSRVATPTSQPKLSDLGVTKTQSSRWPVEDIAKRLIDYGFHDADHELPGGRPV